jgi:hypothetical protein
MRPPIRAWTLLPAGLTGLISVIGATLQNPHWWVIVTAAVIVIVVITVRDIVQILASCWIARWTNVAEWSPAGWKRAPRKDSENTVGKPTSRRRTPARGRRPPVEAHTQESIQDGSLQASNSQYDIVT